MKGNKYETIKNCKSSERFLKIMILIYLIYNHIKLINNLNRNNLIHLISHVAWRHVVTQTDGLARRIT